MSEERQRAVFITGAAGGLGRSSTQLLVKKGWQVFAADYDQAGEEEFFVVAKRHGSLASTRPAEPLPRAARGRG